MGWCRMSKPTITIHWNSHTDGESFSASQNALLAHHPQPSLRGAVRIRSKDGVSIPPEYIDRWLTQAADLGLEAEVQLTASWDEDRPPAGLRLSNPQMPLPIDSLENDE